MKELLLMCYEFFMTGLFAIGGGLATIPFLKDMSIKYGWFTLDELTTMIAVSESTPGPIGVNMSTYVGNMMFGFGGGLLATLSLVAPSIIVICIIAKALEKFKDSKIVQGIFTGLRPAVVGLVVAATISIFVGALLQMDIYQASGQFIDLWDWKAIALFVCLLAFYIWKNKIHPIFIIIIAACVGMLFGF